MKQKVIQTIPAAMNAAELIIGGITELGATVTLHYNVKADVDEELVNLVLACGDHEQGKQVKATRRNALVDAINETEKFIRAVRDMLKLIFGYESSDLWTALGFAKDSLALPTDIEVLKSMLNAIRLHFTNNPTHELAPINATAAQALALYTALLSAQQALTSQDGTVKELMDVRDAKFDIVRKRIGAVYRELGNHLTPLDRRWSRYGFNAPGADETPEGVTGVIVTVIGPSAAAVKWEAAMRAQHYRVWIRVLGVDADYRAVGSPVDLNFTIENLPANATIDILVTAVNNGGEGARSEAIRIVTH